MAALRQDNKWRSIRGTLRDEHADQAKCYLLVCNTTDMIMNLCANTKNTTECKSTFTAAWRDKGPPGEVCTCSTFCPACQWSGAYS